ncbi:MAG TPA: MFS transporter [Xanthobacteraceae bacterium]|nr:MFS transporter [Xanthobacteraceae bacterium]
MAATASKSFKLTYSVFALLLVVANLRPALTSVGPLLETIRTSLGLSDAAVGLLPTLPLLIFAGLSLFAHFGEQLGIEKSLAWCLALIVAGIALRSEGSIATLFAGTAIFSAGIAVANVLVPSLIKRDYADWVGGMTTAYVMVMTLSGAFATGLAVPLSTHLAGGWTSSLAIWAVFAALALLIWLPETRNAKTAAVAEQPINKTVVQPMWRSALAWQVTVFMGIQFLIYFVTIGWIPPYLTTLGFPAAEAGWLLSLYQLVGFAVGVVTPPLLRLGRDQRLLAVAACLVTALCVLGLLVAPGLAALWLAVSGGSFGITFILAFALIGLRTSDYRRTASLSAMAQATGYLIAAIGPAAFGWLHDLTGGWTVPMLGFVGVAVMQALAGFGAGRQGLV